MQNQCSADDEDRYRLQSFNADPVDSEQNSPQARAALSQHLYIIQALIRIHLWHRKAQNPGQYCVFEIHRRSSVSAIDGVEKER
jgi:hypothetical protein